MNKYLAFILFLFLGTTSVIGQNHSSGDSTLVESTREIRSIIYNEFRTPSFFLTKQTFGVKNSTGSDILSYSKQGEVGRIFLKAHTKYGTIGIEYYFSGNDLIYVFEAFEYFNEYKTMGSWKNFKGLSSWESKYYIIDNEVKFQMHTGKASEDINTELIIKNAYNIRSYIMNSSR